MAEITDKDGGGCAMEPNGFDIPKEKTSKDFFKHFFSFILNDIFLEDM
jgi:hypothetical protein